MNKIDDLIKQTILQVIKENKIDYLGKIEDNYSLKDDLGFDSLNMVHLVVKIEDEYNVDMFSEGKISTVIELID
jgi:acyl carrier protein